MERSFSLQQQPLRKWWKDSSNAELHPSRDTAETDAWCKTRHYPVKTSHLDVHSFRRGRHFFETELQLNWLGFLHGSSQWSLPIFKLHVLLQCLHCLRDLIKTNDRQIIQPPNKSNRHKIVWIRVREPSVPMSATESQCRETLKSQEVKTQPQANTNPIFPSCSVGNQAALTGNKAMLWYHKRSVWSDLRTTHLLLPVGDAPDESVEISIGRWAQIKVLNHSSQYPGVGLSQPPGSSFDLKLPDYVLMKKW